MHVQVSLTIEIEANASIAVMEQQIQEAGQQAMRQAMKQAIRQWEEQNQMCPHCGDTAPRASGEWKCPDSAFAVWRVGVEAVQPVACLLNSKEPRLRQRCKRQLFWQDAPGPIEWRSHCSSG